MDTYTGTVIMLSFQQKKNWGGSYNSHRYNEKECSMNALIANLR